jgi:hypothetical protein
MRSDRCIDSDRLTADHAQRSGDWRAGPLGIKDRERERMGLGFSERTFEFCYNVKFRITQGNFTRSLFLQHKVASFGTGVGS